MPIPTPGTTEYEKMVEFMRADLLDDMKYTKVVDKLVEMLKSQFVEQGKDFDEEFEKWKNRKTCVACGDKVDWDFIKDQFSDMLAQVDYHGVDSLTENQQVVYEGRCCSYGCYLSL